MNKYITVSALSTTDLLAPQLNYIRSFCTSHIMSCVVEL